MKYSTHRYGLSEPTQLSLLLMVLVLSISSLVLGSRVLLASLNQYRAGSFLSHWEQQRHAPSDKAWEVAAQAMHSAIGSYPAKNSSYAEQLGYMWQWRAYGADSEQASTKDYQQQAINQFRQATDIRPSWPYAWSGLAYAKLVAGEHDQEFIHSMRQAAYYGPSRIGVNRRLAEIGLISWPKLDQELRKLTLEQASYTAHYSLQSRAQLFDLATEVNRVELLCQHLQDGILPCAPLPDAATSPLQSTSAE